MDLRRLRFSEQIPPAPVADARRLRSLPPSWAQPIVESAVDGLLKRADGLAGALAVEGHARAAADLRRSADVLRRADALHTHAARVETLAQLYVALVALMEAPGEELPPDASVGLLQAGALSSGDLASAHGAAFRETAALRSRAFRQLEAAVAALARQRHP
jgi:hypothetical protein